MDRFKLVAKEILRTVSIDDVPDPCEGYVFRVDRWRHGAKVMVEYSKFKIVKETPASYVIDIGVETKRIMKNARRSFAYVDPKAAFRSFHIRNIKRIGYLKAELKDREAIELEFQKIRGIKK